MERGEALGIIGPNGAGKSTILKILSRIMRPDRGSARVTGRLSSLIEVGAGFHWDLTGREIASVRASKGSVSRDLDTVDAYYRLLKKRDPDSAYRLFVATVAAIRRSVERVELDKDKKPKIVPKR